MRLKVIIIDDQSSILESMEMFFRLRDWEVFTATNGLEGLKMAEAIRPSLVILDIRLPGMSGLEVLGRLRANFSELPVVMITAFQSMESTIQAIKLGAFDYLHKPIDITELDLVIQRLEQVSVPDRSSDESPGDEEASPADGHPQIIARSRGMKEVFKTIALVSESRVTVLIQGESGTGKELIARSIHDNSAWSDRPFTIMDCSTFVDTLMESELFGYDKGAFTGANETRKGPLELTGEGTIFFDEIGELPLKMQSKLLRFLQSGEFVRVGGNRPVYSNARIIAATNRDLTRFVQARGFREDLYYRLKVVTINVPPLRDRKSDIPILARFFLRQIARCGVSKPKRLAPGALELMMEYDWPGNVRQLENALTRAAVLTPSAVLTRAHTEASLHDSPRPPTTDNGLQTLQAIEREQIIKVLDNNAWHFGKVCAQLRISRPTLRARMKKYGLSRNPSANS